MIIWKNIVQKLVLIHLNQVFVIDWTRILPEFLFEQRLTKLYSISMNLSEIEKQTKNIIV